MLRPSPFDMSFLTDRLFEVQHQHQRLMRQLLCGQQPDRVPVFEYAALSLPAVGPYDCENWLAEKLNELKNNFDLYCDTVTWRIPAFALSRYGLHFISAVLGCEIQQRDNKTWCVPFSQQRQYMENFRIPDLEENQIFLEMLDLIKFVDEVTQNQLPIELPFLAEPLLAAVDLFGAEFLTLLADEDSLADRLLADISSAILNIRSRLLQAAGNNLCDYHTCACPMPNGYTFLHGCTTHLVSAQTYRDRIAGLDAMHLTHEAEGGCIHLCGQHTQHIPTWRSMPAVRAVQLNDQASLDVERYWSELRSDQFVVLWVNDNMSLEQVMKTTRGRRLAIRYAVSSPIWVK